MPDNNTRYPNDEQDSSIRLSEDLWLRDVLAASRSVTHRSALMYCQAESSPEFAARCIEAAGVAAMLTKLAAQRHRVGFVPLPIRDYLESLAQGAQIALEPILRRVGIADITEIGLPLAHGWAQLAAWIGIDICQARQHFRISFAESQGENVLSPSLARAASSGRRTDPLDQVVQILDQWTGKLEPAKRQELQTAEAEIRRVFDSLNDPRT